MGKCNGSENGHDGRGRGEEKGRKRSLAIVLIKFFEESRRDRGEPIGKVTRGEKGRGGQHIIQFRFLGRSEI